MSATSFPRRRCCALKEACARPYTVVEWAFGDCWQPIDSRDQAPQRRRWFYMAERANREAPRPAVDAWAPPVFRTFWDVRTNADGSLSFFGIDFATMMMTVALAPSVSPTVFHVRRARALVWEATQCDDSRAFDASFEPPSSISALASSHAAGPSCTCGSDAVWFVLEEMRSAWIETCYVELHRSGQFQRVRPSQSP